MKKYKVGNKIISCDSPVKAVEIAKKIDSMKAKDGFQPRKGQRFTFDGTKLKEYIVTNTDAGGQGEDHSFEYCEVLPDGTYGEPQTMRYSTAMSNSKLKGI